MDNFKLKNTNDNSTTATFQTAYTPELRHEMMYNFICRHRREIYLTSGTVMERFRENKTRNGTVPFPNNSQNCRNEIQERSACRSISAKPMGMKKEKGQHRIV